MRHSAVILSLGLALSGGLSHVVSSAQAETSAWTMWKGDPQRTGASEARFELPLNLVWRHSTDAPGTPRGLYPPLVVGPVGDRRVYFVVGRNLYCINAQNGTQWWKSQDKDLPGLLGAPLILLPGETGDLVLTLTSNGRLTAFRTQDGGVAWEGEAKGAIQGASPLLVKTAAGERILLCTTAGRIVAFTRDGNLDNTYNVKLGGNAGGAAITSTPALTPDGKTMFVTLQDQKLYAINVADGKELYKVPLGTTSFQTPLLLGDRVILAVAQSVRSFDQRTGNPQWTFNTRGRVSTSPVGRLTNGTQGRIYAGTERGSFYALDLNTGQKAWETDFATGKGNFNVSNAVVMSDLVLVGTKSDSLYALRPSDGKNMWQYRLQTQRIIEAAAAAPVAAAPVAIEGGEGGEGRPPDAGGEGGGAAPTAPTGPVIRTYGMTASPIAVDGQVFVLGDNAALYAFESANFDAMPPYPMEPSLALTSAEKKFEAFHLDPDEPMVVPGAAPLIFAVTLSDPGSGVVPDSIKVLVNATAVPNNPTRMAYDPGSGILSVNLIETKPGQRPILADGVYTIAVTAQDYRGNEMNYTGTFTVDRTAPAPSKIPPVVVTPGEPGSGAPAF